MALDLRNQALDRLVLVGGRKRSQRLVGQRGRAEREIEHRGAERQQHKRNDRDGASRDASA